RNSVVECQLPKLDVVGSNPIARLVLRRVWYRIRYRIPPPRRQPERGANPCGSAWCFLCGPPARGLSDGSTCTAVVLEGTQRLVRHPERHAHQARPGQEKQETRWKEISRADA